MSLCDQPQVTVTVSKATRDLLAEHASLGVLVGDLWRFDGRVDLQLDAAVAERLATLDPDPDTAIRKLLASGVGHA